MTITSYDSFDRVMLDVGANDGATSLPVATAHPRTLVVAFEPSPALADELEKKAAALSNYLVVRAAVDVREGQASFNVAPLGTGSLRTMAEESARDGWLEGVDITERVAVRVVRLDRVLTELGISRIDYLHCDAQGNDLNVLRSLGAMLSNVRAGVIEIPGKTRLYVDGHSRAEAIDFLISNGFRATRVVASDVGRNEQNVYFMRVRRHSPLLQRLYRLWFLPLSASSGLWVLPARLRVALRIRTRLRRIMAR